MSRVAIVLLLYASLLLVACSSTTPEAGQLDDFDQQLGDLRARIDALEIPDATDTAALEERVASVEQAVTQQSDPGIADGDMEALESRISALEEALEEQPPSETTGADDLAARVAALEEQLSGAGEETAGTEHGDSLAFQVAVAMEQMDTAGFHGMDEALNEEGREIDPQWLSTVRRVERIVAVTQWPEPLDAQAGAFRETLQTFAASLENDDPESAMPLAAETHEAQHALSHEIEHWLSEQGIGEDSH